MLFNTYVFIFGFLPVVLAGYFVIARTSHKGAALWVGLASLVFYGWWNPKYVTLLLASIAVNFVVGRTIARAREAGRLAHAKRWLVAGLVFDLGVLAFFKYANFFVENANVLGAGLTLPAIVLPLGISFFTFTQITFLVDAYRGIAKEYSAIHYLLFVTYFPHLIAGPVLHHKEMMPQFADPAAYRWNWENIAVGLTIFFIGLVEEGRSRRCDRGVRRPGVRERGDAERARGLGRGTRLHVAALLRLLGLLRHGDRAVAPVRREIAAELRFALQGRQHHRVLAPLAHDALALPARLSLLPARRQSTRGPRGGM